MMPSLYRFFNAYFGFVFILTFILFYPLFYFFLRLEPNHYVVFKLKRSFSRIMFVLFFSRIKIYGKNELPKNNSFIICANHSSYLDIMALYLCINKPFLFMAKAELANIPLFGIFFKYMDIPVDRKSSISAARAFIRAKKTLQSGFSVAIFPEGTVNPSPLTLMAFKPGAFKLAIESHLPIVPVAFTKNHKIVGNFRQKPTRVMPGRTTGIICPYLEPKDFENEKALKDATFAHLEKVLST